jgi:CRP/FNR family cyclic AMP-dependent transcriptional regulator
MEPQHAFEPLTCLGHVGAGRTIVSYQAQRSIFAQGDAADAVCYRQDGQVKRSVVSARGKAAVIAMRKAQAFFGEGCLAGQPRRMATATALMDCALMQIEKHAMIRALHAAPVFAELLLTSLRSRTLRIEEDRIDQLFHASEKRLARVLVLLARFGEDGHVEAVMPRRSHATLAEMIGTTRSRVRCFLNTFRTLGFIDDHGGRHVHKAFLTVVRND